MARKKQETAQEYVRKVFTNAKQKVIFTHGSKREPELKAALAELGIGFKVADMPYETSLGGITYKHTLTVKDTERLQAIIDGKEE